MKKQELEKVLRQLGWRFLRHRSRHDVWTDGQRQEAIPRYTEINDKLARAFSNGLIGTNEYAIRW